MLAVDAQHDAAVHGDEPAIAVVGEALVAGDGGETLDAAVVEAEVEDGVHHPRHRELGAGAHADEQRVGGVAEGAAHRLLEPLDVGGDLVGEPRRPATFHVRPACIGGDGEPGRYGELQDARHLGQVGALAAEEIFVLHGRTAVFVIERVDVWHERRVYEVLSVGGTFPVRRLCQ